MDPKQQGGRGAVGLDLKWWGGGGWSELRPKVAGVGDGVGLGGR